VEPARVQFDNVSVGETRTLTVVVENLRTTNRTLVVDETRITGRNPGEFAVVNDSGAPFTLEPGERRLIDLRFTPESVGEKESQLQIVSNADISQIDVWLSNEQEYLIVQEVAIDRDSEERPVNIDGNFIEEESDFVVDISRPSITPLPANVEETSMTVTRAGNFSMNVTHSPDPIRSDAVISASDRTALQYISVNYSVPGRTFENTSFVFTVDEAAVPAGTDPAEVRFARYSDGAWRAQNATLVSESGSTYRYRVATNGFSQFVITAPVPAEGASCALFGVDYGSFIVCWYWWLLGAGIALALVVYRLRTRGLTWPLLGRDDGHRDDAGG
jgi:PGF-pre-PGF domain-containing protein